MLAPMSMRHTLRQWARRLRRDALTLWFAARHAAAPWYAKALAAFVVAYALSPIDLIPDFIPVLGYVDDVLLLPALIWLALKLLPASVLGECRAQADAWVQARGAKPSSRVGAVVIVLLWVLLGLALAAWFLR